MLITYNRRGGILMLVAAGAVTLVAAFVAVTLAATLLVVMVGLGAIALAVRALVPRSWLRRRPVAANPADTIEGTVVKRIE
jgi:hypothetical protein